MRTASALVRLADQGESKMEVTTEMLCAALKKATEAGLLPRNSTAAELADSMEVMHTILQAALDTVSDAEAKPPAMPPLLKKTEEQPPANDH